MTIKYAVMRDEFEYNPSKFNNVEEAYWADDWHDSVVVALCDTIEEARAELDKVSVKTEEFSYKLARATVAYIDEGEWDKDENGEWEFCAGSNLSDFKCA